MYLCADEHDEICYTGHYCPCCEVIEELAELNVEVNSLETDITVLEDKIEELEK